MDAVAMARWKAPATTTFQSEESQLIEQARTDPEAMAELFRTHYPGIFRYVCHRMGRQPAADDVTSEVFLTMVRCLPRYRITSVPFRAWLYRLATNQVNRWARGERRRAWKQLHDHAGPATDADQASHLRSMLLLLPTQFQSALSLHYLEEMSVEAVAQVLGCAVGTVKSRLSRGRDLLKQLLKTQDDHHA